MKKKVLVLPGDGVGIEVCDAALMVLEQFQLPIEFTYGDIGWECWKQEGDPVPQATWQKIAESDAVLLGAVTSKGKEAALKELAPHLKEKKFAYVSPVIQLRQKLGLFANIRPIRYIFGPRKPFQFCVIRENSEGLYAGLDFRGITPETAAWLKHPNLEKYGPEEAAWTVRLQTRFGLERLFEYAFSYARKHGFKRVTFADKPNVMRESGQFAQEIFEKIAQNYPEIEADIHNVDAVALWIATKPEQFGVIVAENMFGDILSDLAAGVMGGLGLASSANVGSKIAYFEPVHGSAPRIAGQNKANPAAMLYTTALLLEHLGFQEKAKQLSESVDQVIRIGKTVTYDLGGVASTRQMAEAVLNSLVKSVSVCRAAIITVGDELLSGQYLNTNLQDLSQSLNKRNIQVTRHFVCADQLQQISETVIACLGQEDLIIISGGLGPTSDDKTRDAVAQAVQQSLVHHEAVWQTIKGQLQRLGIAPDASNARQALFPETATVLDNLTGTAPGFYLSCFGSTLVVLPGPPSQALALLENYLEHNEKKYSSVSRAQYAWTLIGIDESTIAHFVDCHFENEPFERHFLWKSPYVLVQLVGQSSAPLAQHLIEEFENHFRPYLVGAEVTTASKQLAMRAKVHWFATDPHLLQYFQPTEKTEKSAKNVPELEVEVSLSPSLEILENQEESLGHATITIRMKGYDDERVTFPYTRPLLGIVLQEYAAWLVLTRYLQTEKRK
ncbi:molybdenum cofactor synthesis domain-containing protein [Bartonella sp. DB5-6]|uniref:isocitrate/isopropylmalate dehydrogenase family protein n=1 Tax=Bartonella sp. DB5-6 TaxID=1094755 RepID=UPI00026E9CD9|nr:isocitrate/isopropylmalate dehydrogenase family protein [Bartonella sp. DB5-6]EJF77771.1 molybdenum cofactor synthesis domain-containing protein [Bartonella sp. DB5-6]